MRIKPGPSSPQKYSLIGRLRRRRRASGVPLLRTRRSASLPHTGSKVRRARGLNRGAWARCPTNYRGGGVVIWVSPDCQLQLGSGNKTDLISDSLSTSVLRAWNTAGLSSPITNLRNLRFVSRPRDRGPRRPGMLRQYGE